MGWMDRAAALRAELSKRKAKPYLLADWKGLSHQLTPLQRAEREFASLWERPGGFSEREEALMRDEVDFDSLSPQDKEFLAPVQEFKKRGNFRASDFQRPKVEAKSALASYPGAVADVFSGKGLAKEVSPNENAPVRAISWFGRKVHEALQPVAKGSEKAATVMDASLQGTLAGATNIAKGGKGSVSADDAFKARMTGEAREGSRAFQESFSGNDVGTFLAEVAADPLNVLGAPAAVRNINAAMARHGVSYTKLAKQLGRDIKDGADVLKALAEFPFAQGATQRGAVGFGGRRGGITRNQGESLRDFIDRRIDAAGDSVAELQKLTDVYGGTDEAGRYARGKIDKIRAKLRQEASDAFDDAPLVAPLADEAPQPTPKLAKDEVLADNEFMMQHEGAQHGRLSPVEGSPGHLMEADPLGPELLPRKAATRAAGAELNAHLRPNTIADLQRANMLAADKSSPLAVTLGAAKPGYKNDLLVKMREVMDKPVDKIAPSLMPTMPKKGYGEVMSEAWSKAKANFFPKGGIKDKIKGFHPITAIDDLWRAAGGNPIWEALEKGYEKIPAKFRRPFVGSVGNEPAAFSGIQKSFREESGVVNDLTAMVNKSLSDGVTQEEKGLLEGLLRGNIDPKHLQPTERNMELLRRAADSRQLIDEFGSMATQTGLLKDETFMKNVGKYLPQLYRGTELESLLAGVLNKKGGMFSTFGERFMKRKMDWDALGVSAEGRMKLKEMGAIQDPSYTAARAVLDVGQDVATTRFASRIAADETLTSAVPKDDWIKVGPSKKYGALADKYVHPDVYHHIKQLEPWFGDNKLGKIYDRMMGLWKAGKTTLNPATHARNIMSQAWMFEGATGKSWLDPREWSWFKGSMRDFANGDELYKQLDQRGLFRTVSSAAAEHRNELKATLAAIDNKGESALEWAMSKPGKIYKAEDDLNRYLLAKHARESGMGIDDAVKFAKKHGIDYGAVGPVVNLMSRGPMPFIKYSWKAMPLIAEYLVKRPLTMAKYPALLYAVDQYAKKRAGWNDEDEDKAEAILDKTWMGKRRQVMLPFKDDDGRTQYLDLSFFLPSEEALALTGNPLASLATEIPANKDLFNNRPIWSRDDEKTGRKWFKVSDHIFKKIMPAFAPGPGVGIPYDSALTPTGGHSIDKLANAVKGRPDYLGRKRSVAKVLADIFMGLRIQPVDFAEQSGFIDKEAKADISALKSGIKKMEKQLEATTSGFDRKRIENNLERSRKALEEAEGRQSLPVPGLRDAAPGSAQAPAPPSSPPPAQSDDAAKRRRRLELELELRRRRAGK